MVPKTRSLLRKQQAPGLPLAVKITKQRRMEMPFYHANQKALNTTFKFISGFNHKPYIIFRTTTPDHFEKGEWNTGGYCNRTRPFKAGHKELEDIDEVMRNVELEEFEMSKHGVNLHLLDTTWLPVLRPGGHPGVYRMFHPYDGKDKNAKLQNDCLHWCLPARAYRCLE